MSLESEVLALVASRNLGALATIKRDGRPQLSNVTYTFDADTRVVRMSLTADRAKVRNLRRDPRASLLVWRSDGWTYGVAEGDVELSPVAKAPDDETVSELVDVYRQVSGEHPDWAEFRQAMVDDRRLVARLAISHAYGLPSR